MPTSRLVAATLCPLFVAALAPLTSASPPAGARIAVPALRISNLSVTEGDGPVDAVFTVRRSPASRQTARVQFRTADGSAKAGSDYVATRGTLVFKPGERSKRIVVSVLGDTVAEEEETFFVELSKPTNARIAKRSGRGLIGASDLPPPFTLTATMDGDQMVGPTAPGSRGARGTFSATFDAAGERFSFTLTIEGLERPIFVVHIHRGRRGEFGGEALTNVDPFPAQNGSTSGIKRLEVRGILELASDPEGFYIEIHLGDARGGIRGQLSASRR